MIEPPLSPPTAIEETIKAISRLHVDHHASATRHQRAVDRITSFLCQPLFLGGLSLAVAGWIMLNSIAFALGAATLDPPPFPLMASAVSVAALYFVVLVLTTQQRGETVGRRRELLVMELAILGELKTTKVIALLEELRRDSPGIHDRIDEQAEVMSRSVAPLSVSEAIKETRSEAGHPQWRANKP